MLIIFDDVFVFVQWRSISNINAPKIYQIAYLLTGMLIVIISILF